MSLIGRPYPFVALEKAWTMDRFTYTAWEELVEMAKQVIPDPRVEVAEILKVCPELDTERKIAMVREANQKYAMMFELNSPDMLDWFKTQKGAIRLIYVLLKRQHPDITIDTAVGIISSGELDFEKALSTVMGVLPPKESSPGE